ncbi:hybrid sensor histidine kinase/response regulator [Shimia aestuarii]|uniref:hybrid sensor histidine kinase/response regulator n=1 Tax=Shimia aestuarii TaxID=254406 RepID=UPI001FB1D959|nr:response regulator [Shimia aestuarii]
MTTGDTKRMSQSLLGTIARMIATDRRAVLLASPNGSALLANSAAQRLGLDEMGITEMLDWPSITKQAKRATSLGVSVPTPHGDLEGEIVFLPLLHMESFLVRLTENDVETALLRNKARAATLMRVAHDLRTPIQSLLASAEEALSATGTTEKDTDELRNQLQRTADIALEHISNVLAVIRGEQNAAGLKADEDFNINDELRSLLSLLGPIAHAQQTELKVSIEPMDDTWVHGPVRFVRALFQNMTDNAVKYGGREVHIRLRCIPIPLDQGDEPALSIVLEVCDTGGGLPDDQKDRLTRALRQTPQSPSGPKESGQAGQQGRTSAGLNVLAHSLHQLGGKMDVIDRHDDENAHIIGTCLRASFTLPAGAPPSHGNAPVTQSATAGTLDGARILLVEDSPSSRDWIRHTLQSAGASVSATGTGIEALSLLEDTTFLSDLDLILTDMTLPYMNGVQFATKVLQPGTDGEPPLWAGPIIGLTAHSDDRIVDACMKAGIRRVLEKPIRPKDLCQAISEALNRGETGKDPMPDPQSPPEQPAREMCEDVFRSKTVSEIIEQFGRDGAITFIRRSQKEARDALAIIRQSDLPPDIGRILHAATGASSLTGLAGVEKHLRELELAVEKNTKDLGPIADALENALTRVDEEVAHLPGD